MAEFPMVKLHDIECQAELESLQRPENYREDELLQRITELFNKYDCNQDGYLNISEMKTLIKEDSCKDISKDAARRMLKLADNNNNNKLSFEEFHKICIKKNTKMKDYALKYVRLFVPKKERFRSRDAVLDYEINMTYCPPPFAMFLISVIELIFFIVSKGHETVESPIAKYFIYNPETRYEVWRFFTYMFIHIGTDHLISNLLVQLLIGFGLELVYRWWRVALVYMAGVLAGSMASSIFTPNELLAGASGGVYALVAALVATIIINWYSIIIKNNVKISTSDDCTVF